MISPRTGIWFPANLQQIANWWRAFVTGLRVIASRPSGEATTPTQERGQSHA